MSCSVNTDGVLLRVTTNEESSTISVDKIQSAVLLRSCFSSPRPVRVCPFLLLPSILSFSPPLAHLSCSQSFTMANKTEDKPFTSKDNSLMSDTTSYLLALLPLDIWKTVLSFVMGTRAKQKQILRNTISTCQLFKHLVESHSWTTLDVYQLRISEPNIQALLDRYKGIENVDASYTDITDTG